MIILDTRTFRLEMKYEDGNGEYFWAPLPVVEGVAEVMQISLRKIEDAIDGIE